MMGIFRRPAGAPQAAAAAVVVVDVIIRVTLSRFEKRSDASCDHVFLTFYSDFRSKANNFSLLTARFAASAPRRRPGDHSHADA